jgi:glycosyltransferase involved in cell wall biosynthesis
MSEHAAITIVSKNYLSYAEALGESFKKHHPDHDFLIVLVDRADGYVSDTSRCGAEIIEMANIAIPDVSRFIYRYSIMELNTAVKPFALADLFARRRYKTLLYIDPDILIFRPLTHVYEALESASIVLTPHMRRPYYDQGFPSDVSILQSGTYNLGFIGLKAGESADKMLQWWMDKLHKDCIVDIPNGLFVDQKWMDLVPGFFPDHKILHSPGYNAAYWNLHERPITQTDAGWLVDGEPLTFFHFSGYIPFAPASLSKHQNRHNLASMPALHSLTNLYARLLLEHGYEDSSSWPYAFEELPNGVRVPLPLVRAVMQWVVRTKVATPCPIQEPDQFCRFLMSRGVIPGRPGVALIFHFLLQARGDVASTYRNAANDSSDEGFRNWVTSSGTKEYALKGLLKFEDNKAVTDHIRELFERLRSSNSEDLEHRQRAMWANDKGFIDFAKWIAEQGHKRLRVSRTYGEKLLKAAPGIGRILNIYFLRGDLQVRFPVLWHDHSIGEFTFWLEEHRYELGLDREEISLFLEYVKASRQLFDTMRFLYLHKGRETKATPNIYSVDARRYEIESILSTRELSKFLFESESIDPFDHFFEASREKRIDVSDFRNNSIDGLDQRQNFQFVKKLQERIESRRQIACHVNFAGYGQARSGMGESARSMRRTLEKCGVSAAEVFLPHVRAEYAATIPTDPYLFGWPKSGANVSITVANADAAESASVFLPRSYWADKNVGYWVWETEELPARFKKSEDYFDEIWTPSQYSADAISRTIGAPVRVVPHALDFEAIDRAKADRRNFGLPESGVLFGFMFEPESGIERKNVSAVIRAFEAAFRPDDNCYLVLKVNGRTEGILEYEMLRAKTSSDRILFCETSFPRTQTFDFMRSLDAYVSLHRAEGFGLTCAEAMASGLPVIASNYSGNLEFMSESNSLLINTRVICTERPYGPYPSGTRWGDPDVAEAASAMRNLLERSRRLEIGQAGRAAVYASLHAQTVGANARRLISDLLDEKLAAGSEILPFDRSRAMKRA